MSSSPLQRLLGEMKRRRVGRTLITYGVAVFALLQGAQPVFEGLLLPDFAFRVLVVLAMAGFPAVFVLAWVYELTADGVRKTKRRTDSGPRRRVPLRRWLQVIGIFMLASTVAAATAAGLGRVRFPVSSDDGRVGVAVFPFRTTAGAQDSWSEGAADLLSTALDGTAGLRIVDPWSLWRPLRAERDGPAGPPDVEKATRLAHDAGAHRFVLGAVVGTGSRVDVTLRLYQVGRVEPLASFVVSGAPDSLVAVVRDAAVRVMARIWGPRRPSGLPTELDFDATRSPEALQAYLAAKEALRQGRIDSANAAIDRAIALDTTFVLATVEAVTIKSWGLSARGQAYAGFFPLLDRAEANADSVNDRTRLRIAAVRASVSTDGAAAFTAVNRILEIDPADLTAAALREYVERAYGWQFGASPEVGRAHAENAVRLDSTYLPVLASRAWWAVGMGDEADVRLQLERIARADTTSELGHGWLLALRADLADQTAFAAMLDELVALPSAERFAVLRVLRVRSPDRAARYLAALAASPDPTAAALSATESARLLVARGRPAAVDSAIADGALRANDAYRTLEGFIVAASLAGVGEDASTRHALADLSAFVTPDSARAQFEARPVWWFGWLIGAHAAQTGDTLLARRWIRAIGTLPKGGSPAAYTTALQADIESRLAGRRNDQAAALDQARRAYLLWNIHADNTLEALPDPAIRFRLGMLYRAASQPDSARALFSSLVPPTTWAGFLTARASFELGELAEEAGDRDRAVFHYTRALRLWEGGGAAAADWLQRVRERVAALVSG